MAFAAIEGSAGQQLDPTVVALADQLADLPVTVAQISLPPEGSAAGGEAAHTPSKSGMMYLYDAHRIAWEAFGRPNPGELILIGRNGDVLATGSLRDPQSVLDETRRLGQIDKDQRDRSEER